MISSLEKYKKDLDSPIIRGESLILALTCEQNKSGFEEAASQQFGDEAAALIKGLPENQRRLSRL
jgi:hypothetical protein